MPIVRIPVVLHANCPHAKCPNAKCPHANSPHANSPHANCQATIQTVFCQSSLCYGKSFKCHVQDIIFFY